MCVCVPCMHRCVCACVRACVRASERASERACILMYVKHWDDYVWANGRDLVLCTCAQNYALKIVGLFVCAAESHV